MKETQFLSEFYKSRKLREISTHPSVKAVFEEIALKQFLDNKRIKETTERLIQKDKIRYARKSKYHK